MGWQTIGSSGNIRIFSISEEIKIFTDTYIDFFINISPSLYVMFILMITCVFIIYLFIYISKAINIEGL